jgi:hypothetical protein
MTHLVTRITTRPNNSVEFWQPQAEVIAMFTAKYRYTQKILSRTCILTDDQLQEIVIRLWNNIESWQEFMNDEEFSQMRNEMNEYNIAHGITMQFYDFNLE